MITEERIRAALHEASARVDVDEDLAWQRAWLEVARQPARGARRTTLVFAVAAAVIVSVVAWQLFTHTGSQPTVTSGDQPAITAAETPKTIFDGLEPNDEVSPLAWVTAANALASARGNVAGTIDLSSSATNGGGTGSGQIQFAADREGQYRVVSTLSSQFGLQGTTFDLDVRAQLVRIDVPFSSRADSAPMSTPAELLVTDTTVDHVLRPGAWVGQELATEKVAITFLGRADLNGRSVNRFQVTFAASDRYPAAGWEIQLDARTGVVLAYVVHYLETAASASESATIGNFTDNADVLRNEDEILPGGYRIQATVDTGSGRQPVSQSVPAGGASIGAVLEQIRRAAK